MRDFVGKTQKNMENKETQKKRSKERNIFRGNNIMNRKRIAAEAWPINIVAKAGKRAEENLPQLGKASQ